MADSTSPSPMLDIYIKDTTSVPDRLQNGGKK
ncbi:hypothetical protein CGMCC3_g9002 [Colletotrichum fructicola]|uniref:Uncharacterized protein n=1 Tax=Colletotrichum chrysophilum TaxID=1836956 RepID=A0AAD9AJ91_9PEZI|nr:uncharacterized protein CGMCC3_g9002 [Colletotrichum fructicola]KAE9575113.1 hypothetical protein CGMCC3_g9002 [Colletotrichum fructicola]KAK1848390.1 hypothetical protein CCHR01_09008 [Colletotrichum chrysophilum]